MKEGLGRQQKRFHLRLPVTILTKGEPSGIKKKGNPSEGRREVMEEVFTHDISAKGCYFRLSGGVSLGSEIEIEIQIPAMLGIPGGGKLHCRATVVRIDGEDLRGNVGVGCRIQRYKFSNPAQDTGLSSAMRGHLNGAAMHRIPVSPRIFASQDSATMLEIVG